MPHDYIRGDEYKGNLQVGQHVYSILYGGNYGIITKIYGEQHPETIRSLAGVMVTGGSADFDILFPDHVSNRLSESILRGVQWHISDEIASEEEIRKLKAEMLLATQTKEEKEKAEAEERRKVIAELPGKYPYLTPASKEYGNHAIGAKNLRTELKRAFPGVKFSVRSKTYSGGDSISVAWFDGPTTKQVKAISDRYQECDFDGMDDSTHYRRNPFTNVFGGANYVDETRYHTREFLEKVIEGVTEGKGSPDIKIVVYSYNNDAHAVMVDQSRNDHDALDQVVNRTASKIGVKSDGSFDLGEYSSIRNLAYGWSDEDIAIMSSITGDNDEPKTDDEILESTCDSEMCDGCAYDQDGNKIDKSKLWVLTNGDMSAEEIDEILQSEWYECHGVLLSDTPSSLITNSPYDCIGGWDSVHRITYIDGCLHRYSTEDGFYHA